MPPWLKVDSVKPSSVSGCSGMGVPLWFRAAFSNQAAPAYRTCYGTAGADVDG